MIMFPLYFFPHFPHTQALMIGDDLVNDVGGAQHCGIKGVQVRTGKYRSVVLDPQMPSELNMDSLIQSTEPEHDS